MSFKENNSEAQKYFSENYDLKLALSISKTEVEANKLFFSAVHNFENIVPPFDAFEIIKDRLNLFYN